LETTSKLIDNRRKKKSFASLGWGVSIILHVLILAIPISLVVQSRFKEVEIFVLPVVPFREEKTVKEKPPVKRTEPRPIPLSPTTPKEKILPPPALEPTALSESPVVMAVPPMPVSPAKEEGSKVVQAGQTDTGTRKPEGPIESGFGEGDGPRFLNRELPEYPPLARRWGKEGKVVLRLSISEKGELIKVEVVTGQNFGLTEAAVQAVKKSTFLPARQQGKPVACRAVLPILFVLRRE
jgi:protein TonB